MPIPHSDESIRPIIYKKLHWFYVCGCQKAKTPWNDLALCRKHYLELLEDDKVSVQKNGSVCRDDI